MKRSTLYLVVLCLFVATAAAADVPSFLSNRAPEGHVPNPGEWTPEGGGCPCASGTPEGEANCGLPTDTVNGGCNSIPEVTSPITPNSPVCGTAAYDGFTRDTDWYEYTVTTPGPHTWQVETEFAGVLFIIDNVCPPTILAGPVFTTSCGGVGEITLDLAAGTYRFFVAPDFSGPVLSCGVEYTATLVGPGGPSVLEVPAASTLGLLTIALLLGAFAIYRLRRRAA